MCGSRKRWVTGLLWLALALLPLRGMANAIMATASDLGAASPSESGVMAAPCHVDALGGDAPAQDLGLGDGSACGSCDLCHAPPMVDRLAAWTVDEYQPPRIESRASPWRTITPDQERRPPRT